MRSAPEPFGKVGGVRLFGTDFAHPVLLAAGSCGFGEGVVDILSSDDIGGLVTKSVTLKPRRGNAPPRVVELPRGMGNSVGLANPGVRAVRTEKLPWMRRNLGGLPVFVSVAGRTAEEYASVVAELDSADGFLGFELNLSCPNDLQRAGRPFCLDPVTLRNVVAGVRPLTSRPLLVKLAPKDSDIGATASLAAEHGADGITAINTVPGLPTDAESRLGAGTGAMSGPAILPTGLAAVRRVADAVDVPVLGVGGILTGNDALAYFAAGASLVQVGTGSFADPRCGARVAEHLAVRSGWTSTPRGRGRRHQVATRPGGAVPATRDPAAVPSS